MSYRQAKLQPGKTCRELLPEWYGYHIRVGFAKGSGFVYCKMCDENTEQELAEVEEKLRADAVRNLAAAEAKLKWLEGMGLQGYIQKKLPPSQWDDIEKRLRVGELYDNMVRTYERSVRIYSELQRQQDMILGARFLECYPSIDPEAPNTLIVILDGDIGGRYWSEKEYMTGKVFYTDMEVEE